MMQQIPKPQEIYKHFKGNLYQIVTLAIHTENEEPMVVYQALYGDYKVYVRPLEMFLSEVDHEKYPEAAQKMRFERIQETIPYELNEEPEAAESDAAEIRAAEPEQAEVQAEEQVEEAEEALDPMVMAFLDADSYEEKRSILDSLRLRITDSMLTTMALACDIELNDGDLEERCDTLRNCLLTLEKYECRRLR